MMKLPDDLLSPERLPLPAFLPTALALAVASLVPLGQHVLWCIEHPESMQHILLLVAGLAIPPLGWAHGMSLLPGFGGWL